jgi:4-hydroxyphenylpyruvate dioxygenase-like putative hemolysin
VQMRGAIQLSQRVETVVGIAFVCTVLQTFLEQNEGPGLQHLALKTDDIFHTMRELRKRSSQGGFDFMPRASDAYYKCAMRPLPYLENGRSCVQLDVCMQDMVNSNEVLILPLEEAVQYLL